jgi:hypothetical protein
MHPTHAGIFAHIIRRQDGDDERESSLQVTVLDVAPVATWSLVSFAQPGGHTPNCSPALYHLDAETRQWYDALFLSSFLNYHGVLIIYLSRT